MEYSDKIYTAFKNDCTDLLFALEENLAALEKRPDDPALVQEVFRLVHSLKSESALIGFSNFSALSHAFEDLFARIRSGKRRITPSVVDLFYRVMDEYKVLFRMIQTANTDKKDIGDLLNALRRHPDVPADRAGEKERPLVADLRISDKELALLKSGNYASIFLVKIKLFDNVALKYARAFLVYSSLITAGEVVKSTVRFDREEEAGKYGSFSLLLLTSRKEKEIYDLIDGSEVEQIQIRDLVKKKEQALAAGSVELAAPSIRVSLDRIEELMSAVGELTVSYNRLEKFNELLAAKNIILPKNEKGFFLDLLAHFKRIISGLQDEVMKIRLVPIKILFSRFPRLIHTLSRDLGKKVNLTITGEDTFIDKTVVEKIRDPLTHIIRNAIDHGIESPGERAGKGKSPEGTIRISSYQSGSSIMIEIADDGRGIDPEKVRSQILRHGLLSREKAEALTPRQVLSFIFLPGMSTRGKVTELSGRGVGMDVVKKNLKEIGGTIQVRTEMNKGTVMTIGLPITVAVMHSLILRSGNAFFAIPLPFIQETLRIPAGDIRIVDHYEVIYLRKKVLSLLRLNDLFGMAPSPAEEGYRSRLSFVKPKKGSRKIFVVVVHYGKKRIGLVVDQFVSEQDLVIKPLSGHVKSSKGLVGAAVLGDGGVAYILDPVRLVSSYLKGKG